MAAAPGLQRSSETFRRSGSSGMVWEDRFAPDDEEGKAKQGTAAADVDKDRSKKPTPQGHTPYKAGGVAPSEDPPSPKVSACGFCSVFGGGSSSASKATNSGRRHKHAAGGGGGGKR